MTVTKCSSCWWRPACTPVAGARFLATGRHLTSSVYMGPESYDYDGKTDYPMHIYYYAWGNLW